LMSKRKGKIYFLLPVLVVIVTIDSLLYQNIEAGRDQENRNDYTEAFYPFHNAGGMKREIGKSP